MVDVMILTLYWLRMVYTTNLNIIEIIELKLVKGLDMHG